MLRRSAQALLNRGLMQGQAKSGMGCLSALNHLPSWTMDEEKPSASSAPQQLNTFARCKYKSKRFYLVGSRQLHSCSNQYFEVMNRMSTKCGRGFYKIYP